MSSFGGSYGKTTGDYVNEAKDAIVTMIAALPEITIKDEEDEFVSKEFKEEYEKIYSDVVEYTTPIIKALNGLPVYYRHHIKNGLALGKGLKIIRYQDFTKKRKQSQKRKETKRNEGRVNKKRRVEDVEDVEVDKKRRVEDVEKLEDVFASFNIEDDDVPDRQYIETHGLEELAARFRLRQLAASNVRGGRGGKRL